MPRRLHHRFPSLAEQAPPPEVEAAIIELDYVPSAVARSLKARSTATIGLLCAIATASRP